jgi:hypothetical protein
MAPFDLAERTRRISSGNDMDMLIEGKYLHKFRNNRLEILYGSEHESMSTSKLEKRSLVTGNVRFKNI